MKKYFVYIFFVLSLFLIFEKHICGQESSENTSISFCDLLRNPEKYDGKQVTVYATYRYGFEWQEMYCLGCRDLGKMWLEFGELTKKSQKILKRFPKDNGTINAIFIGEFESSKGPFGDGGYKYRFVLKDIKNAEFVTKSSAVPEQLTDNMRKNICGSSKD